MRVRDSIYRKFLLTSFIGLASLPILLLATGVPGLADDSKPKTVFRTAAVERGNIVATVWASGTLEPEAVIDISAQVTGVVKEFGPDPKDPKKSIDYCSAVEAGTVLAKIDDTLYAAAVEKAKADLGEATAAVQRAKAEVEAAKLKLSQIERDWNRIKDTRGKGVLSDFDIDTAKNAFDTAKLAVPIAEAAVAQTETKVHANRVRPHQAEINLSYCTIKSPAKGVIVDRRVNKGQTVVASLTAPSLFLLATDLKKMHVWASVNEADIGQIKAGQKVTFTVDAFPKDEFKGEVAQVRLNASITDSVVTYTVVVSTDNSTGKLLPYLTANVQLRVEERKGVLLVPNAALRWRPQPDQVAPDAREAFLKKAPRGVVWVEEKGFVRPIKVQVGITDGRMTAVAGDLSEGKPVVIGVQSG